SHLPGPLYCYSLSTTLTGFSRRQVRSTTETLGVGTRKAIPVSFLASQAPATTSSLNPRKANTHPLSSGMTFPTALAAPVEAGIMFWAAPLPSLHSFPEGPSTVFCVAVMAWTVVCGGGREQKQ
uniref:Uncharacterized protein n=1 Tax=Cairina moschata TaxID=8855 RepID=A0A8C3CJU9_CAIMO